MWQHPVVFTCLLAIFFSICTSEDSRTLIYTNGGVFKLVLGWALPLELPNWMSVIFAHNLHFQYPPIDDGSKLTDLILHNLARSSQIRREGIYQFLEKILLRNGCFHKECLLKLICQISETPLSHNGLLGELLQTIFTPDLDCRNVYTEAWWHGQNEDDLCERIYDCPETCSLLERFSILEHA